jgi:hypothetical protein
MPAATPFFAAFGPLLFGRAPRAARDLYQRQLVWLRVITRGSRQYRAE